MIKNPWVLEVDFLIGEELYVARSVVPRRVDWDRPATLIVFKKDEREKPLAVQQVNEPTKKGFLRMKKFLGKQ